jgi:hypothetical protein
MRKLSLKYILMFLFCPVVLIGLYALISNYLKNKKEQSQQI